MTRVVFGGRGEGGAAMSGAASSDRPGGPAAVLRGIAGEPFYWLLLALPLAVVLDFAHAGALAVFVTSAVATVPLAGLMGRATESLAKALGPGVGGLLNATFGNAAELILALFALARGPELYPLVKASLTGSILGNVLLVLGMSVLAGGLFYRKQQFNRTAAGTGATLLALAAVGLLMPALYYHSVRGRPGADETPRIASLSEEIAAVLAGIYLLSLVFALVTHRHLFREEGGAAGERRPEWHWASALGVLLAATAGVAWMSELLVGTVEAARAVLGMNRVFVGVVVVAVVGNAAEHSTAVWMAVKNQMDAAVQIAVGSGTQIALFVAPVLVFASLAMGHARPLDLHFTLLETVTVAVAVVVLALVCQDGETHWLEGAMMLGVYAVIALAFYNLPD
jgi:Ca2+:H+ antiporter